MRAKLAVVAFSIVTAAGLATAAKSTVPYSITYTGVVTRGQGVGIDFASAFGNGADLVGKPVTVVFTIDPTKGNSTFKTTDYRDSYGHVHIEEYDLTSKSLAPGNLAITASIQMGSLSTNVLTSIPAFDEIDQAIAQQSATDIYSERTTNIDFYDPITKRSAGIGNNTAYLPYDAYDRPLDDPFSYDSLGVGGISTYVNDTASLFSVTYDISNVTVRDIGGVPEPASWAMFIAGFGLIGGAMRRRRSSVQLT